MRILIIGSGGREHTLAWKISRSKLVSELYSAPGNGGMAEVSEIVDIKADDIQALAGWAKSALIDLVVVGPEAPLAAGIVDECEKLGIMAFGPRKNLARLESSKVFAKSTMDKFGVPTAGYKVFSDSKSAHKYIESKGAPMVVKADGLCGGKGAIVAKTEEEAKGAVSLIMDDRIFADAGCRVVIEDYMEGEEASLMVVTDGKTVIPLASSQDHKRIYDHDKGPNTGGMGAYSPAPVMTAQVHKEAMDKIIRPVIDGLRSSGEPFRGVLYAGLMITDSGVRTLEFNVRFGDPEIQAVLPRLRTDFVEVILASIQGKLDKITLDWDKRPCVCVVVSSGGYPGNYDTGKEIRGLEDAARTGDTFVFHAGTKRIIDQAGNKSFVTSGGRVLGVTALGDDIQDAIDRSYDVVRKIQFQNMYYRTDIGYRALSRLGA